MVSRFSDFFLAGNSPFLLLSSAHAPGIHGLPTTRIRMQHVKSFLCLYIARVVTIDDVAAHFGLSSETLRKNFYRSEHVTIGEYIAHLRVEMLKEYIRIGGVSYKYACYAVGLREDSGARLFHRHTGMTMSQYHAEQEKLGNVFSGALPRTTTSAKPRKQSKKAPLSANVNR